MAQKVADRLSELGYKLCDFAASHSAASLMTSTGAGGESESKRLTGGGSARLEAAGANTSKKQTGVDCESESLKCYRSWRLSSRAVSTR